MNSYSKVLIAVPSIGRECLNSCLEKIDFTTRGEADIVVFGKIDKNKFKTTRCPFEYVEVEFPEISNNIKSALNFAKKENYKYLIKVDDDCFVKDGAIDRIVYLLHKNVKFPYIASIGNYNAFLRMDVETLEKAFIPTLSCDVLFGLDVSFCKKHDISIDTGGGNRYALDLCLSIFRAGGIPGMVDAKMSHRLTGTKEKTYDNYFRFSEYLAKKHSYLMKMNKRYCISFRNKPDSFKKKYKISTEGIIEENL
jgi:hypothetical protein